MQGTGGNFRAIAHLIKMTCRSDWGNLATALSIVVCFQCSSIVHEYSQLPSTS